ncbi:HaaA family cyclophane-containing RiPP peptide [Streptomyces sp. NRRL F-2799]|uniref:HaaA family cyclophane-containing RiPP peptide n=1 Tax=Streptomyces sp. NRRL F-2799 TaxID=1463844 RepID=UPI0004C65AA0|nr:HaaA family cyclophane-containing RiPP peptide [Streptomyces sp. NRRL F-2799]
MPSPTPRPTPPASRPLAEENVVLDRVAVRVRQRRAAEQAAPNRLGEGAHAASLIWPWPF